MQTRVNEEEAIRLASAFRKRMANQEMRKIMNKLGKINDDWYREMKQDSETTIKAYRMSLRKALSQKNKEKRLGALKAAKDEVRNLMINKAIHPIFKSSLTQAELDRTIRAIVFADEKHRADGSF
jgi:ubiquitin C-terminal hydrolase